MTSAPRPAPVDLRQFYKTSERYLAGLQAKRPETFETFCNLVREFIPSDGLVLEVAPEALAGEVGSHEKRGGHPGSWPGAPAPGVPDPSCPVPSVASRLIPG